MRTGITLFALFAVGTAFADEPQAGTPAKNRIAMVTVYQGNALVTREVTVPGGAGLMELVVSPLPPQTLANSPYAEGSDGIRVLNTRFRTIAIKEDTREEVRKLANQIRTLAAEAQKLQADLKLIQEHQQFLTKLESFTGATLSHLTDKGMLNSEATIALAKFVMAGKADKSKEAVEVQQRIQDVSERTEFTRRQLAEKTAGVSKTERVAVVTVDKANAEAGTIRLNYLVDAVNWRPQYKFRAGDSKHPVSVEYLAAVHQQTGEDWTNVAISLSTAQPMLNAAPPDLRMLAVTAVPIGKQTAGPAGQMSGNVYKQLKEKADLGRAQSQNIANEHNWREAGKVANEAAATEQTGELLASRDELADFRREQLEAAGATDAPSVTYKLRGQLSVPSRGEDQVLEVARFDLAPEYFFKAVPVLTSSVYRQANLTNKSEYVLFPGEASMYLGADFVGKMALPLVAVGKPFSVSFGVDPQLSVQRTLLSKNRVTSGGNQVLTFDYRILVNSYKSEPVKVQVWERLPKGEAQAINVSLTSQKPDLSADALYLREDRPKNLLRWDVTVDPSHHGEKAFAIDYTYRLELDKQMQIGAAVAK